MTISTGMRNAHILGKELLISNNFDSGLCCFGTVGRTKFQYQTAKSAPCHAALSRMDKATGYQPLKMVDVLYETPLSSRQELMWYSFILERSVYSSMFAERRAKTGHKRGYFIYNTDVNANILAGGAVAIRQASEHTPIVKHFCGLVEAGTDEDIAFIVAHAMYESLEGYIGMRRDGSTSHVPIYAHYFSKENLLRYFKADVKAFPSYRKVRYYSGINSMFKEVYLNKVGGNIIKDIHNFWVNSVNGEPVKRRVALFNLSYNDEREGGPKVLPRDKGYPLLANILNKYKQEVLANA